MDSDQTWAMFWFAVIVAICTLIGSCTVIGNNNDARKAGEVKALVDAGKSPIEARCAVYGAGENSSSPLVCQAAVTSAAILKSQK